MLIIPFFGLYCNLWTCNWREIKTPINMIPGSLCSISIVHDQSAWALTFLKNSLERSLVHYHAKQWKRVSIPCNDPHLLATGSDGAVFIVGRNADYHYSLWRLLNDTWHLLGSFETAHGYPTNLVAQDKDTALVALCPCRGSNQPRSSIYVWNKNNLLYIENVLNHNAIAIDDNGILHADLTITNNLSDNISFLKTRCSLKPLPIHTSDIVIKNDDVQLVRAGCSSVNTYFWCKKTSGWLPSAIDGEIILKGSHNKRIYLVKQNKALYELVP